MTIDQATDRDPFALGGRSESLTARRNDVGTADASAAGDAALFDLIAEYRRLDNEHGRMHAEAERLEEGVLSALPKAEVEYGVFISKGGERTPFIAKTEEEVRSGLAQRPLNEVEQRCMQVIGASCEYYFDRRDELIAELSARKAAIAQGLEDAGVDVAFARANECDERLSANLDKILSVYPATLAGADAVRDWAAECLTEEAADHVIECYRVLASRALAPLAAGIIQSPLVLPDEGDAP